MKIEQEIIQEQIAKYKAEFTERPVEYVHGDYTSFLSQAIKESIKERDIYWTEHLQAHRKHCTPQGNKEMTKVKSLINNV